MLDQKRVLTFWWKALLVLFSIYGSQLVLVMLVMQLRVKPLTGWWPVLGLAAGCVPVTLAILAGFVLAASYMQALYALKGKREAFWFIVHCLIGQASIKPWLMVESGKLSEAFCTPDSLISKVGGPGNVIVRKDSAAVLEQAGRLTRVVGPGKAALGRFERLYDMIDLRPRRWQLPVTAMSKEGIPVDCDTEVVFQILDDGREPTGDNPFPMDPEAVFRAATSKWIREAHRAEGDRILDWKGHIVLSAMEGTLRFILARYPLDRLIAPEREGEEHPRQGIRRELEEALHKAAPDVGAKILRVELGEIKVRDEITQQWIESWRANWDRWGTEYLAEAEAFYVEKVGKAKAEVVAEQISDMADVLHKLARQGPNAFSSGVRMQLHLMLRNLGTDSLALTYLPTEATKLLMGSADQK